MDYIIVLQIECRFNKNSLLRRVTFEFLFPARLTTTSIISLFSFIFFNILQEKITKVDFLVGKPASIYKKPNPSVPAILIMELSKGNGSHEFYEFTVSGSSYLQVYREQQPFVTIDTPGNYSHVSHDVIKRCFMDANTIPIR